MIKLNLQTSLSTPLRSFSLGSEHSTVVAFQAVTPPTRVQVWSSTTFFLNFFFPPHSRLNHRVSVTSKHANFFVHKKQETATHTDALNHFFFVFCMSANRSMPALETFHSSPSSSGYGFYRSGPAQTRTSNKIT